MIRLLNILTQRKWYYDVTLEYRKDGQLIADARIQLGVVRRSDILSHRRLKDILARFVAGLPRHAKCNGTVFVHVNAYIGYLKSPRRDNREPKKRITIDDMMHAYLGYMIDTALNDTKKRSTRK